MSSSPFHPINSITQAQPLSLRQTEIPIHPNLKDVYGSLHASDVCGIVASTTGDKIQGRSNNQKSLLGLIESTKLIESIPAASPAAGNASEGGAS
jgi:hypothetical protein